MEFTNRIYLKMPIVLFSTSLLIALFIWLSPKIGNDLLAILFFTVLFGVITHFVKVPISISFVLTLLQFVKFIIVFYLYSSGNALVFPDSFHYIRTLETLTITDNLNFQNVVSASGTLQVGYYYFAYFIYSVFNSYFSLMAANTFLISVSLLLFYKTFAIDFNHKISSITILIAAFSANLFLFGSFLLKDALVVFLIAFTFYLYKSDRSLFVVALVVFALTTVRIYAGFSIFAAVILDKLLNNRKTSKKKIVPVLMLIISMFLIFRLNSFSHYIGNSFRFLSNFSITDIIISLPTAFIKFSFAPLPWNLMSSKDLYSWLIADSALFLLMSFSLLLFVFKWLKQKDLRQIMWLYLTPIFVHALALGLEYGGDSTRQRSGIFIVLILLFVLGLFYNKSSSNNA